jgi:hypothetical protein
LHIAQRSQPAVAEKINSFIKKYETEILNLLLGEELYAAFKAAADPVVEPLAARWAALLNGADFTDTRGNARHWVGFANKEDALIAGYIYFHYLRSEARKMTGSGAVTPNVENATRVDVIPLQVHAWNDMVKLNGLLFGFLHANSNVYPEWSYADSSFWLHAFNLSCGYQTFSRHYFTRHHNGKLTDLFYTINSHNL